MRNIKVELFKFEELNPVAQNKAYFKYWNEDCQPYPFQEEVGDLIEEIESLFNINIERNDGYYSYQFKNDEILEESNLYNLRGVRLYKYIINNFWDDLFPNKIYYNKNYNKKKKRKSKILVNNSCPLTGIYLDNLALEPIYNYIRYNPSGYSYEFLIEEIVDSLHDAINQNYNYYYSFDNMKEELLEGVFNWEFLEDGTPWGI